MSFLAFSSCVLAVIPSILVYITKNVLSRCTLLFQVKAKLNFLQTLIWSGSYSHVLICDRLQFLNPCWIEIFIVNKRSYPKPLNCSVHVYNILFVNWQYWMKNLLMEKMVQWMTSAVRHLPSKLKNGNAPKSARSKNRNLQNVHWGLKRAKHHSRVEDFKMYHNTCFKCLTNFSVDVCFVKFIWFVCSTQSVLDLSSVLIVVKSH